MEKKSTHQKQDSASEDDVIWSEIKDVKLDIFGLPNQMVEMHCVKHLVEPSKLYITFRAGAILLALEAALGEKFEFGTSGKYTTLTRK